MSVREETSVPQSASSAKPQGLMRIRKDDRLSALAVVNLFVWLVMPILANMTHGSQMFTGLVLPTMTLNALLSLALTLIYTIKY